ncbi:MAG: hypothetical protein WB495_27340 [Xanthobacteraceae bacterium]
MYAVAQQEKTPVAITPAAVEAAFFVFRSLLSEANLTALQRRDFESDALAVELSHAKHDCSTEEALASAVVLIDELRSYVGLRRGKGKPMRREGISSPDMAVLNEASESAKFPSYSSILRVAKRHLKAGKLPRTTSAEGHAKRIQRRHAASVASHRSTFSDK